MDVTRQWRLTMFGTFRAEPGDVYLPKTLGPKNAALLAYLACHLGEARERDELADVLWGETDDVDRARGSLRAALVKLRALLEPPGTPRGSVVQGTDGCIRLNPETVSTDLDGFRSALSAARRAADPARRIDALREAIALYRGDLLPKSLDKLFSREWLDGARAGLRDEYAMALSALAESLEASGDLNEALETAQKGAEVDPESDAALRTVMRLLGVMGRLSEALRLYLPFSRRVRRAGRKPVQETRELVKRLRAEWQDHVTEEPEPAKETAATRPEPLLPRPATPFFGRERELSSLQEAICQEGARLITLTGPGGCGKTRLAIEAARQLFPSFAGGAWYVPLADCADASLITSEIRDAMGLPRFSEAEPTRQVIAALRRAPTLLVLDNFERLAGDGAPIVKELREAAPGLACLVTSRHRLKLAGERKFPVEPLPIPDGDGDIARLSESPSVRLFVDRARAACPDFVLTPENAPAVAAICRCLDGLPLALELAGGWASVLSPGGILRDLGQRFQLLESWEIDVPERHRSLRAAIDGSYDLLPSELRRFFAALSIFRGGWTLDAAQAVCLEPRALAFVRDLDERSLLASSTIGAERRFRMLDTLRAYAAEKVAPDDRPALSTRHAVYMTRLAETAEPHLLESADPEWTRRLEAELDNVRAALEWLIEGAGDRGMGLRLATAMFPFWLQRNHFTEGRRWLEAALAHADGAPDDVRARAMLGAGALTARVDEPEAARGCLDGALALFRKLRDRRGTARALFYAGLTAYFHPEGYVEAQALFTESLSLFRALGDTRGVADVLEPMGLLLSYRGETEQARATLEEALALCHLLRDVGRTANTQRSLGDQAWRAGDLDRSEKLMAKCLRIFRDLGDRWNIAYALTVLGNIAGVRGDTDSALARYRESLALFEEMSDKRSMASVYQGMGLRVHRQRDPKTARECLKESLILRHEIRFREGVISSLRGLGILAADAGDARRAARLFGQVERLCEEETSHRRPAPIERADAEAAADGARAALGGPAFSSFWAEGREMGSEQAITYALGDA